MGLLVSSEHCIASPKLAPVASLVSAPNLALSFIHTISTTYRFGPCGVVGDALALWLPRSVPAISPSATKTELFRARDRWFESISLQRGVSCEPDSSAQILEKARSQWRAWSRVPGFLPLLDNDLRWGRVQSLLSRTKKCRRSPIRHNVASSCGLLLLEHASSP